MPASVESRPVVTRAGPSDVVRGLVAGPGLVVLSGAWARGSVIVAVDPVEVARNVDEVFGTPAVRSDTERAGSGREVVGGGWFGWLGYPNAAQHWFGRYPNVLRHHGGRWYDEALPGLIDPGQLEGRRSRLTQLVTAQPADQTYRLGALTSNQTRERYTAAVERCLDHIRAGEVYQANICLRLDAVFTGSVVGLYADLLDALKPSYAALICDTDGGAVVSLSPELFLWRGGRMVTSAPIKGTRPRAPATRPMDDPQRDALRSSPKERAENVMIVDLIRNDLARVSEVGTVRVPSLLKVSEQCGVWHMTSTVEASLRNDVTDAELLRATFPPGSVTGAPKVAAAAIIDALEPDARGVYTGALGYLSPIAGLELSVAIRTAHITAGRLRLGVGAGITAGSTPVEEWWECFDKATPIADRAKAVLDVPGHNRMARTSAGVFETVLIYNGRPVELDAHLERLARSAQQLWGRDLPATLRDKVNGHCGPPTARLRVDLGRSGDVRLSCTPTSLPSPVDRQAGVDVAFETFPDGFGGHKNADRAHLDRLEHAHPGRAVVVVDQARHVLESTRANVLAFVGDRIVTPPLDGRILPGITRRAALDCAIEQGCPIDYRPLSLDDLADADGLALCGSLRAITWVRQCPVARWDAPPKPMIELSDALLRRWLTVQ